MNRGVVAGYNFSIFVYDSYGSPNTRYGNSAIDVGINGGVGNGYYAVVDYSYGSPYMVRDYIEWFVRPDGVVSYTGYYVADSYGG